MSTDARMVSPPLATLLQATAQLVAAVMLGGSTARLLPQVPSAIRPATQALLMTVLRHWGLASLWQTQLAQRSTKTEVKALLQTALALLLCEPAPYQPHTLVDQAVLAAKREPALRHAAGFINACLRKCLAASASERERLAAKELAQFNLPDWWVARMRQDHGVLAQDAMLALRQPAPMSLRVNARWGEAQDLAQRWRTQGIGVTVTGRYSLQLHQPCPVTALPGFAQGWCSVQDWAAQLSAPLLLSGLKNHDQSMRLLDACAAPGGKTAQLAELSQAQVWALDQDATRAQRIHDNLERLRLQARVVVADAAQPSSWWDGQLFDGILLDAPCTGSGIVRRHPDVPWLRRAEDVLGLAIQQKRLLEALWPLLKPGGILAYCTCSVFKAEGQTQIEAFLQHHNQAQALPAPGHLLPRFGLRGDVLSENRACDHDGFYHALLLKQA